MNFSDMKCDILELRGDNYKVWKERILLHLGWMDIDYAIRKIEPAPITETSQPDELIFMKIDQHNNVYELLKAIDDQFVSSDKALASTLIMRFTSHKLTGLNGVREHIMQIRDIAAQLKSLEVDMSESFLVHYILNTLSSQYAPFKISYNTHKDEWSINELMTMCVQEEGRLSMDAGESVHMAIQGKNKDQAKGKGKANVPPHAEIKNESKCFICKKKGHIKKDCPKFKIWLEKKGNKMGSRVKAIGTCRLAFNSSFVLVLEKTFYIPNFSRNLISVSRLVPYGYSFNFGDDVTLFYNNHLVGNGTLSNGLYHINLQSDALYTLHISDNAGIKRCVMNEDSFILWHRRLGHIFIERIKKLVNDGVLNTLDLADSDTCMDYIKGKQTNVSKKEQGIVAQYTMSGFSDQNGVAERRNRTLLDMVRSMMASSKLPKSLWIEALKTAVYILNRVPTKVRVYNPQEKKLDPRTITGYFVGYAERSKGYRYYCPSNSTRIVESRNAKFFKDDLISGNDKRLSIRSTRIKRSAIPGDYVVYLQEFEFNIGAENNPETFSQAMISRKSNLWYNAMKEEMNSMKSGILSNCLMDLKP
ncbi:UNVERIFIED_CONTAM: Copia protein [Sesamum latifolium]|uniref:Copia protein n=1 Tax=Sesamum latifolium TaxID=2727402 RepID=A0AAW2VE49_9LAMI